MKVCRDCKLQKNDEDFYKRKSNSDGLYSYCKTCTKKHLSDYNRRNSEVLKKKNAEYRSRNREKINERTLKYYYENKEKILLRCAEYRKKNKKKISLRQATILLSNENRFEKNKNRHKRWSDKNRDKLNLWQKEWYQRNKEKRRAHVTVHRAVKKGLLIRPEICSRCERKCRLDAHHEDYSKPLDVKWLCKLCHSRESPRTVIRCSC